MMKAKEMGMEVDTKSPEMITFLDQLKRLEHSGYQYEAADASFELLLSKFLKHHVPFFELRGYRVIQGRSNAKAGLVAEATVKMEVAGYLHHCVAESTGPVSALYRAISSSLRNDYPAVETVELRGFQSSYSRIRKRGGCHGPVSLSNPPMGRASGKRWGLATISLRPVWKPSWIPWSINY